MAHQAHAAGLRSHSRSPVARTCGGRRGRPTRRGAMVSSRSLLALIVRAAGANAGGSSSPTRECTSDCTMVAVPGAGFWSGTGDQPLHGASTATSASECSAACLKDIKCVQMTWCACPVTYLLLVVCVLSNSAVPRPQGADTFCQVLAVHSDQARTTDPCQRLRSLRSEMQTG